MEDLTYTVVIVAGKFNDLCEGNVDCVAFEALPKTEAFDLADKAMLQGHSVGIYVELPEDS